MEDEIVYVTGDKISQMVSIENFIFDYITEAVVQIAGTENYLKASEMVRILDTVKSRIVSEMLDRKFNNKR